MIYLLIKIGKPAKTGPTPTAEAGFENGSSGWGGPLPRAPLCLLVGDQAVVLCSAHSQQRMDADAGRPLA